MNHRGWFYPGCEERGEGRSLAAGWKEPRVGLTHKLMPSTEHMPAVS